MDIIFAAVYYLLLGISILTGLTYKEVNIVVYYVFIPLVYIALIDKIIRKHSCKIIFSILLIVACFVIQDMSSFAHWLFDQSVIFLESFDRAGLDYTVASVVICVIIPLVLFCVLFYWAYPQKSKSMLTRFQIKSK